MEGAEEGELEKCCVKVGAEEEDSAASKKSEEGLGPRSETCIETNLTVADFFNPDGAASATIRLFTGRSFLSLPPNQTYHLVPDSKPSGTASTQTEPLKTGKAMNFACPTCHLKCRDNFDFVKHIDRMHTPHWFDDGGKECEKPFCSLKLQTKY